MESPQCLIAFIFLCREQFQSSCLLQSGQTVSLHLEFKSRNKVQGVEMNEIKMVEMTIYTEHVVSAD